MTAHTLNLSHRDAHLSDLPPIVAIYNATIPTRTVTADTTPVTVESRRAWFAAHTPDHHPLWVAELHGSVVGWLDFHPFNPRPAYQATAEISIYVAADYHRRGIGHYLLHQAIERSPSLGLRTLVGLIVGDNTPSLRFFARAGFARWGHLPRVMEFDGTERDLIIVGRRIEDRNNHR